MGLKLANNAVSRLAGNVVAADTIFSIIPGEGAKFPTLAAGDWFPATIVSTTGDYEVVKVTARSADTLTVQRAQEGTTAISFEAGDRIELRLTAGVVDSINSSILALLPTGFGPLPWSRTSPPDGWIWSDGRVLLADTPYASLRAIYVADGYPYGQDGSGNPRIPDACGRVLAGRDNMSGAAAGRLTGATSVGASLGAQSHTLTSGEMPVHAHGVNDPTHAHGAWQDDHNHTLSGIAMDRSAAGYYLNTTAGGYDRRVALYPGGTSTNTGTTSGASAGGVYVGGAYTGISIQNAGSGGAHNNVQPTLVLNFILKV